MKRYKEYKSSEIEWLGDIPTDWDVKKIKWMTSIKRGASPRPIDDPKYFDEDGEYAWVRIADVSSAGMYLEQTTQKMSELGASLSVKREPGDIFVSIAGTVGKPCITNIKCCIHDGFVYFPDYKGEKKYLYYIFESGAPYKGLGKMGTQLNLNTETIGSIKIPNISLSLQRKIALFLDTKVNEIDTLLNLKQKQINTLEQQRQSIITEAVTKGLNLNVQMKESGVEWIGEIPEHWEVKKIKFKFDIRKVIQPTENPTVLSLTQRGLKIKDLNDFSGQHAESYAKYQKVEINDYVMNGMDLLTGYVDCSSYEGVTSPDYRVFRIKDNSECHNYYLRYFQICYFAKIFYGHGQGVSNFGRWRLQTDVFKEFPIPVPSREEQFEISEYLKAKEIEIDKALELIKLDIEKLKEYRQALIYETVTGKINVCDMELD